MDRKDIKNILYKVDSGTASAEEEEIAKYWLHYFHKDDISKLSAAELDEESELIFKALMKNRKVKSAGLNRFWYSAVAAAIVIITGSVFFYNHQESRKPLSSSNIYVNDVAPGTKTATLTLANGKRIVLSDALNGQIAKQAGVSIIKTPDGQLIYKIDPAVQTDAKQTYNSLTTSRSETYQIILPDGSKVWLNAASSIKYPSTFAALKKRVIELNGEAYFEISKDKERPFIVKTADQEVEVLGTHFNVNAYGDEEATKTTLLEGSVRINIGKAVAGMLKPGQQGILSGDKLEIEPADIETELAWKNGFFRFNDEKLESIMRKISRWYDIEVVFENDALKKEPFAGVTTRFTNVSELLRMLELTGEVKFQIKGRQIRVLNAK
ncbi:FecR family protein [Pedobacter heparinus]|uniref:FecR family protein n=1 Tax=Pedobacter heparinus TaxID=984 RepID=UPI00292F17EF|nr:FecR domain-containing protein [Pedobacter heparinus]